jgi:hypothetical protein
MNCFAFLFFGGLLQRPVVQSNEVSLILSQGKYQFIGENVTIKNIMSVSGLKDPNSICKFLGSVLLACEFNQFQLF